MPENAPNTPVQPEANPAEDAFVTEFMTKGKVEPVPAEPAAAPEEKPEAKAEDERDPGDESPEAPADEPKASALTTKGARLAERLLTTGFRFSPERVDRLTDEALADEAMRRATETLQRAGIPKRLIDGMTPEEKLESAIQWRPRILEGDRARSRRDTNDIGEEAERLQPRSSAGVRKEPTTPEDDPLAEVGDALELLDEADREKVKAAFRKVQGERTQLSGQNEAAMRIVRSNNLADAFVEVAELMPEVAEDHQAVLQALKDQCDALNLDFNRVAATGGKSLVQLTRLAAEQLGFAQKPRRDATETPPKSRTAYTPPKPKGSAGRAAPTSEDAKDLVFAQAFLESRGDPNRAAKLYTERVTG